MAKVYKVSITQLKISRPFLKVFARNLDSKENQLLLKLESLFARTDCSEVQAGDIYIAHVSPKRYQRCRVLQFTKATGMASVFFIDCGYMGSIKLSQVRIFFSRRPIEEHLQAFFVSTVENSEGFCRSRLKAAVSRVHSE
jgi:Tudor domain